MKNIIQFIILCLFIYSCSSDNEVNEGDNIVSTKLIESLSFDNETSVDSLFYDENKRIILKKEYLDLGQLDYKTHYQYNSENNLIKTYRIHSTSNIPIEEINYTYYPNGNLKSRNYVGYNSSYTDNFEYESNSIIRKRNQSNEIRVNLDSNNKILSVERKNINNEFYIHKEYVYEGKNITEIRINENSQNTSYFFEYDNKNNPFTVFDHSLPNNLSIKKIEAIILNSNYPFITIGDDDNYFGFLNNNNVLSCSGNSSSNYSYYYDSENYPTKITYDFLFNQSSLIITYK
tara:strand:+ start:32 stop:898 length:867 start_codon:yes stop_codon:yes gene_type:complete